MYTYVAIVSVIGLLVLLRILFVLKATNRRRLRQAKDQVDWEAIRSDSPADGEVNSGAALDAALERIDEHFSVSRRLVVPLIVFCTAGIASIPLLDQVPTTIMSVIAGGVTLVIGIAVRPVIENAVAGLMISHSRTINIGDTVRLEGQYGTIEDISATHTTVKIWNWNRYLVPNGKMLALEFENLSLTDDFIWAHVEFVVGYDADLDVVEEVVREAVESSEHNISGQAPSMWYSDLRLEGVVCWAAGWADTPSSAWSLQHDIRRNLIIGFQRRQIPIHAHRVEVLNPAAPTPRSGPVPGLARSSSAA